MWPSDFIFSGWSELVRTVVVGTLAYFAIVLLLRGAGKRALTKMRAYDFVVTVALGSSLATALLSSQVKLDKAVVGVALLLGLQRLFAWLSTRWRWFHKLVNNEPTLVFHQGHMLEKAIENLNLTSQEIRAAVRSQGKGDLGQIEAVVVETDGSFSVIPKLGSASALSNVQGVVTSDSNRHS
jgi:uncharacterized membrane protein YcaP (DUF421 family)